MSLNEPWLGNSLSALTSRYLDDETHGIRSMLAVSPEYLAIGGAWTSISQRRYGGKRGR